MLFEFDKNTLTYNKVSTKYILIMSGIVLIICTIMFFVIKSSLNNIKYISEETKAIIIKESDKENAFSPDKLKAYILELNIKFPHIVYAQAVIESGHFQSNIFKTNSNLFGMKEATSRPTTNAGSQFDHAFYDNWKKSVDDYAMFQSAYLNSIKTEAEYFEYLRQNYAANPKYVDLIKDIINKQHHLNKQ